MKAGLRRALLFGLLAVVMAFAGYRFTAIPKPRVNVNLAAASGSPEEGESEQRRRGAPGEYALAEAEVLRYIPRPDALARKELLAGTKVPERDFTKVISLTVAWNGAPRVSNVAINVEYAQRSLFDVLTGSLGVSPASLTDAGVARRIPLPGDWVVRTGAGEDEIMDALQAIVRASKHPSLVIERQIVPGETYALTGVPHAPAASLEILDPPPGCAPAPQTRGTLSRFLDAVQNRIGPISFERQTCDTIYVSWVDNSGMYGPEAVTGEMVSRLFQHIATQTGLELTREPCARAVWRLSEGP